MLGSLALDSCAPLCEVGPGLAVPLEVGSAVPKVGPIRAWLSVFALFALALGGGCASVPVRPEPRPAAAEAPATQEEVAAVLNRLADDVSHRRLPRVLNVVSDAYKDDAGRDFAGVKQFAMEFFREYRQVQVTRTPPKITIQGNEARSVETLGILGDPDSPRVTAFNFQGRVAIFLRRVEGAWQVFKVQLLN
jgi:hypothetical protein